MALEVGTVRRPVQASAPLLNSESSSVGAVVNNNTIVSTPVIDRRAARLVRLNGFVVQNGTGSNFAIADGETLVLFGSEFGRLRMAQGPIVVITTSRVTRCSLQEPA